MKFYTGIGILNVPESVRPMINKIAAWCLENEYTLRSGSCPGGDKMFEEATRAPKEIYIPWFKFHQSYSNLQGCTDECMKFARRYHPAWTSLSLPQQMTISCKVYQMLGADFKTKSDFLIYYEPPLREIIWGEGIAIKIAQDHNIPHFNIFGKTLKEAMTFLENIDLL